MRNKLKVNVCSLKAGRINNEDNFYVVGKYPEYITNDISLSLSTKSQKSVFAIADGMGGLEAGEIASFTAVEYVSNHKRLLYKDPDKFFYNLNNKVLKRCKKGGCTLDIAVFDKKRGKFDVFSIGDSPVYYYDSAEDTITMLHELDNAATKMDEDADPLKKERAKKLLTQYLGCSLYQKDKDKKVPYHHSEIKYHVGSVILLCTDGVDTIAEPELKKLCRNHENYRTLSEAIAQTAVANSTRYGDRQDNTTLICIEVDE